MVRRNTYQFSNASTNVYFDGSFADLGQLADQQRSVIITDEHIFSAHEKRFRNWHTIVLKPGEAYKVQQTVDAVIDQLLELGADRQTTLVGVGGGVITDITGYVAAVFMRGIPFGFVPTTILGLVDASIGGKNGVDVGPYKNMVGTIRQPRFILHDYSFLRSLPAEEWSNGFAEVIKHACIRDAKMFSELQTKRLTFYQRDKKALAALLRRNAALKIRVVQADEFETGDRKLLNFGHTLGHALETQYELGHGQAMSIGMYYAAQLSAMLNGFGQVVELEEVLHRYSLPAAAAFDLEKIFSILQKDKKKADADIHYVLLKRIGKGYVQPIPITRLKELISGLL